MRRLILPLVLAACSGGGADVATPTPSSQSAVPPELLSTTWQVRLAPDAARAPFEGRDSWVAYFQGKRSEPLAGFANEKDGAAVARAHAEYAAIYRQAALMAAN
ncbi:MAG: hypothetical protein ACK4N5_26505, partial [Myxococcales bacterium]